MRIFRPYRCYFDFFGRASRREFWQFALFYVVTCLILLYAALIFGLLTTWTALATTLLLTFYLFAWGSLIPLVATAVRRLHDSGQSGWWVLLILLQLRFLIPPPAMGDWWIVLALLPAIGDIALLLLLMWRGVAKTNRFGAPPS